MLKILITLITTRRTRYLSFFYAVAAGIVCQFNSASDHDSQNLNRVEQEVFLNRTAFSKFHPAEDLFDQQTEKDNASISILIGAGDAIYGQSNISNTPANVVAIASGAFHSLALTSDGSVSAWGKNWYHQTNVPVSATNVISIAAGGDHSMALRDDGTIVSWGRNLENQTNVPPTATNVIAIAAGKLHSLALRSDGTVVAWGANDYRQCLVSVLATEVIAISAGYHHNLALRADGTVIAWGDDAFGETEVPQGATNITAIAAGDGYSMALRADGHVLAWGDNRYGQSNVPLSATNLISLRAAVFHSAGVREDGTLLFWGKSFLNVNLGFDSEINIADLVLGEHHTIALKTSDIPGYISCVRELVAHQGSDLVISPTILATPRHSYQWYRGDYPILGATNRVLYLHNINTNESGIYYLTVSQHLGSLQGNPIRVHIQPDAATITKVGAWGDELNGATDLPLESGGIESVSAGAFHSLGLRSDGTVFAWGKNWDGQLNPPYALTNIIDISAGGDHSLALRSDGTVIGWGRNSDGQVDIPEDLRSVVAISAGWAHSVALKEDGSVVSWGNNEYGQVNETFKVTDAIAIAAGYYHTLALLADGTVVAWGATSAGQCIVPEGVTNIVAISAGEQTSLAVRSDGKVFVWGKAANSTELPESLTNAVNVSAGFYHNFALKDDGTAVGWGKDFYGVIDIPIGLKNIAQIEAGEDHSIAMVQYGPPQIQVERRTIEGFMGRSVVLRCNPRGTYPFLYQWYKDGTLLEFKTNRNLVLTNVDTSTRGSYYVHVSNIAGSTDSTNMIVSIITNLPPTVTVYTNATLGGGIQLDPSRASNKYFIGETVTITPLPQPNFEFLRWNADLYSTNLEVSLILTQNLELSATFESTFAPRVYINGQYGHDFVISDATSVEVSMSTTFSRGTIFYTIDGKNPDYNSSTYTGPFTLDHSAEIRSFAVSSEFQVANAEPVNVKLAGPYVNLTYSASSGGVIDVNPYRELYLKGEKVTLTAQPDPGWEFFGWLYDAAGNNPVLELTMETNKLVHAIFATRVNLSQVGSGKIILVPEHPLYTYGTAISAVPVPEDGNFFALWGEEGTGNARPYTLVVTNAQPALSALFLPLSTNEAAISIIIRGKGSVRSTPQTVYYTRGETISLEAIPNSGFNFLNWGGDFIGTNSLIELVVDKNKVIFASFTDDKPLIKDVRSDNQGINFLIKGLDNQRYIVERSADLQNWINVTNLSGGMIFMQNEGSVSNSFYRLLHP